MTLQDAHTGLAELHMSEEKVKEAVDTATAEQESHRERRKLEIESYVARKKELEKVIEQLLLLDSIRGDRMVNVNLLLHF